MREFPFISVSVRTVSHNPCKSEDGGNSLATKFGTAGAVLTVVVGVAVVRTGGGVELAELLLPPPHADKNEAVVNAAAKTKDCLKLYVTLYPIYRYDVKLGREDVVCKERATSQFAYKKCALNLKCTFKRRIFIRPRRCFRHYHFPTLRLLPLLLPLLPPAVCALWSRFPKLRLGQYRDRFF